ncbi:hypothetical protein DRN93_03855 [archaeon]|nr:MAG: hypothetical protein DRN93_03855 [archaeon]
MKGKVFQSRFELLLRILKAGKEIPDLMDTKPEKILKTVAQKIKKKDKEVSTYMERFFEGDGHGKKRHT